MFVYPLVKVTRRVLPKELKHDLDRTTRIVFSIFHDRVFHIIYCLKITNVKTRHLNAQGNFYT